MGSGRSAAVLKFAYYPPEGMRFVPDVQGSLLLGADGVPLRGELRLEDGIISVATRNQEALAISLLWPVRGFGAVQLETTRLPARAKPYHLHVELARHRLMRISLKREEWGLFDYQGMDEISAQIDQARDLFVAALQTSENGAAAARLADQSLALAVAASESMSRYHAAVFLSRRLQGGGLPRSYLGIALAPNGSRPPMERLKEAFDFIRVPFTWRQVQPREQGVTYAAHDALIKSLARSGLAVRGGPVLSFGVQSIPDWMYIWENDYEAIAEFAREHVRRTVQRYAGQINNWIVASGLHAQGVFPFTFEQVIDLTRTVASVTRQAAARSQIVLEITQPWGEYYARNQRTVPPLLYAEMALQAGVPFDAFGLQFLFGVPGGGFHVRDLFQVSSLIDRLANLGKPLHVTAVAAPSVSRARSEADAIGEGGSWHGGWSEQVQAEWLTAFSEVALSKPYVESICLYALTDSGDLAIPTAGVLRMDQTPKPALTRIAALRSRLASEMKR
jgi:hypothetical protein